ncbi:MAG TPA: hypothetical protein VFG93_00920 [Gaiellaceae bacterium]|nr:hypothetical protein [Gaiellaceae bacterium]
MAKKRQTFGKMQRERDRAEKRARKQEKKEERKAAALAGDPAVAEELGAADGEEPSELEESAIPSGETEDSGSPPEPA